MEDRFAWRYEGRNIAVPYNVIGSGERPALILPALSSISARTEMLPLAERIAGLGYRCLVPDWPGFGDQTRSNVPLEPASMQSFLSAFIGGALAAGPAIGIAAGHGATHLVRACAGHAGCFSHLAVVAPTWRGPLPTAMGEARRPLFRGIRRAIEAPVVGQLLYRANVSRPIVRKMLREHVYADPAFLGDERLAAKMSVTRQKRARYGTAAFVTGALDPVATREEFLALFAAAGLPPVLVVRPRSAPAKSAAEMDALIAAGHVRSASVPGALAAHEEHPEAVAAAIEAFLAQTAVA